MVINPVLATILSDLFVNLAAGWLGTVFIVPIASEKPLKERLLVLTSHIFMAIISLVIALGLRKALNI